MKISNSKKHLARIISENGGWRDWAEWAAQDKSYCSRKNNVVLYKSKPPKPQVGESCWGGLPGEMLVELEAGELVRNWHQTILSRAEYFHLYPAPDAEPRFCESVMGSIPEPTAKPTIEQLATDYRNAKDYAERKQQEADAARADADESLKALEIAGEAIGLIVTPITAKKEDELVIEVKVNDQVECVESNIKRDKYNGMVGRLRTIDESDTSTPYLVDFGNEAKIWCHEVKFIRR